MRPDITKETAISYIKQIIFIMFTPPVSNSGYNSTHILQIRYFWIVFKNQKGSVFQRSKTVQLSKQNIFINSINLDPTKLFSACLV